jgi:hypothetical protein
MRMEGGRIEKVFLVVVLAVLFLFFGCVVLGGVFL